MHSTHFASSPNARCLLFAMIDVEDDKDENMLGNDENILGEEHNGDWCRMLSISHEAWTHSDVLMFFVMTGDNVGVQVSHLPWHHRTT